MGVKKYKVGNKTLWQADFWITFPDGRAKRRQISRIPTREMAERVIAKEQTDAFEGRHFEKRKEVKLTVQTAWENYEPVSKRLNKPSSYARNTCIIKHLLDHFGTKQAVKLTYGDVDTYRAKRDEVIINGAPPAPATVNREVALLKRILNYAVKRGDLDRNPLSSVAMVDENNVRQVAIDEKQFQKLYDVAASVLKPILVLAYDTGMRRGEILDLKWNQVDLRDGSIRLSQADTKSKKPRIIILTDRVVDELKRLPRSIAGHVFVNKETDKRWYDVKKMFDKARTKAELEHVWFHDLRRSFVTNARKRNIPESVVMRMSGHRTRAVFERYNVVDEEDLREAKTCLEQGRIRELSGPKQVVSGEVIDKGIGQ